MKPTYVSAQNFQGGTFQHDLYPITVFAGPNDAGKSRILNSIEYALLDYLPKLGKQPVTLKKLMTPNEPQMMVTLAFDDGTTVQRGLKAKPDGEVGRIKNANPPAWEIPSGMFSLKEYLGKTQKQQIEEIFKSIGQADLGFNEEEFIGKLLSIEVLPISECNKAIAELKDFLTKSIATRKGLRQSVQDWLTGLVGELDAAAKKFGILKEQASAQMVGLRPATVAPKSVEREITAKRQEIETVQARITVLLAQQKSISASSRRRSELQSVIDESIPSPEEKEQFINSLKEDISCYSSSIPLIDQKISELRLKLTTLKTLRGQHEDAVDKLRERMSKLQEADKCPFCKSTRSDWKVQYAKELNLEIAKETQAIEATAASINDMLKALEALLTSRDTAKGADMANEAKKSRLAALLVEIQHIWLKVANRDKAKAELAGIVEATGKVDAAEIEKLNGELLALKGTMAELEGVQKSYLFYKNGQDQFLLVEKGLLSNQTRQEVFKKASKMVVEEQSRIVSEVFRPIIATARKFTDGILPGVLDYREGELGMQTDTGWISHEVMATMSQTLTYIGVAIALAAKSPVKLVMIDEGGIISLDRKPKVINRLFELINNGVIDAVCIADPTPVGYDDFKNRKDFQLVTLGPNPQEQTV